MEWHPADGWIVGIAIPVALYLFARAVYLKFRLMRACAPAPDPVGDHAARLKEILTVFFGQKKLFQDFAPGVMHAVIFWGFCVLLLRTLTMFGMAFAGFDFHLPGLAPGTGAGTAYDRLKDAAVALVTAMVLYALARRYVQRVPRLLNTPAALCILLAILGLMLTDLLFDAVLHGRLTGPAAGPAGHAAFLLHCLGILAFLVYLPAGKHMHIVTSFFNVYLRPLGRSGRLVKLPLEDESAEVFGTPTVERLTWKDALDLYSCTECGRCTDMCPASRTGKKLSPREIITAQKHLLLDEAPRLLSPGKDGPAARELLPGTVTPEEIWACTTCQACEQACPVNIAHVQRINSMRRSEVLMQGRFPAGLKRAFKGMETNSNPWGIGADKRMDWAKDLEVPTFRSAPDAEYLLYLGCNAAFDDGGQKVSRSLVRVLKEQKISFAVLGADEGCCGETARRLGEEALGQSLIQGNIEKFNGLKIRKIITPCPHCYNVLKNEYPDFGGKYEVEHHSQLLGRLMAEGRLKPAAGKGRAVFHDPCYLGRVNSVYGPARGILGGIEGLGTAEHERSGKSGFCCGAGGGMFWLDEKEPKINHERARQLLATEPSVIATACPYCRKMLGDGVKDLKSDAVKVRDLVEIISGDA